MADTQIIITINEQDWPDFEEGFLEIYPNESAIEGAAVSDTVWVLKQLPKIIGNIARDGLKRKLVKLSAQVQISDPAVEATLPDGSVVQG